MYTHLLWSLHGWDIWIRLHQYWIFCRKTHSICFKKFKFQVAETCRIDSPNAKPYQRFTWKSSHLAFFSLFCRLLRVTRRFKKWRSKKQQFNERRVFLSIEITCEFSNYEVRAFCSDGMLLKEHRHFAS